MKNIYSLLAVTTVGIFIGLLAASPIGGQTKPSGKLILWGDFAVFQPPGHPENCIVKNRFKRGEPAGFRLYALDGGTNQPETSAQVVVHVTVGGKTVDLPTLYRGVAHTNPATGLPMPVRANQWTAKWVVPKDALTGIVRWRATARDKFGRTTEFIPQGGEPSWVTIVD